MTVGIQPRREEEADPRGRAAPGRRASLLAADFRASVLEHVVHTGAKELRDASALDFYNAFAHTVRDRLVHRWLATQRTYIEKDVKRVCYFSSEFLTGRSLGPLSHEHEPLRRGGGGGGRLRPRARAGPRVRGGSGPRQRRPRAAGGLLHGLAGDAGAAGHRLRHSLRLRDVRAEDRRRAPGRAARQLAAARQHLGAAAPRGGADRPLRRRGRLLSGPRRPHARQLGQHARRHRAALRLVHRRPPDRHREHAAALGGARHARLRPAVLQRRGLPPRRRGEDRHREHLQGPLPQRPERGGQGAAAQAAVLLRRLLDRRHRPPLQAEARDVRRLRRQVRHPAQRHPPVDRRRRADARAARRGGARLGRRLGDHRQDDRLHQPHAPARGAGALAGGAVPAPACRGTCRSSTRSTIDFCTRCRSAGRGTTTGSRACRSSTSRTASRSGWPTWPRSAPTASTAWPSSTPIW